MVAKDQTKRQGYYYEKTSDYPDGADRRRKDRTVCPAGKAGKRRHYICGFHAGIPVYGRWFRQDYKRTDAGRQTLSDRRIFSR